MINHQAPKNACIGPAFLYLIKAKGKLLEMKAQKDNLMTDVIARHSELTISFSHYQLLLEN